MNWNFLETKDCPKMILFLRQEISPLWPLYITVWYLSDFLSIVLICLKLLQSWFSSELTALKSRPDDSSFAASPNNLEPITGMTPTFPRIPSLPNETVAEHLSLPLSKEMALYVNFFYHDSTLSSHGCQTIPGLAQDIRSAFYPDSGHP